MLWSSYGFFDAENTRTKKDLQNEINNLVEENRVLWFMLKDKCGDIRDEELQKQVDDKVNEIRKEIENTKRFVEKVKELNTQADNYFGNDNKNKALLRIAYILALDKNVLNEERLRENVSIANSNLEDFKKQLTMFNRNKSAIKAFEEEYGDNIVFALISATDDNNLSL